MEIKMRRLCAAALIAVVASVPLSCGAFAQETTPPANANAPDPSLADKAESARQADAIAQKAAEENARQKESSRHCLQTGSRLPGNCSAGQQADPRAILNNHQMGNPRS